MSNNLITKEVNFQGDSLLCVQDETTGKIYVGVTWVCNGIGLSEGQIKNEKSRIKKDIVLIQGGRKSSPPYKWRESRNILYRFRVSSVVVS